MRVRLAAATFALLSMSPIGSAYADGVAGFVDGYYLPYTQLEVDSADASGDIDGNGWGIKGLLRITDNVAFSGEYQNSDYDGPSELDSYRLGAGYYWRYFGLAAEYINLDLDSGAGSSAETDGVGIFLRTSWLANFGLAFSGSVGYVNLDDGGATLDGYEYTAGLDYRFTPSVGAFAEYRSTNLSEADSDLTFEDVRVGLRLVFAN
jgi:opacity protein-like surface antigen